MKNFVPIKEHQAVLRMLVRRATCWDKIQAARKPGHWLNQARIEINQACNNIPADGETYQHRNGCTYQVLFVTNLANRSSKHPPQVVYIGTNNNCWSRPLAGWHDAMTRIKP